MILSEEDHKVLNQFSGLDKKANSEKSWVLYLRHLWEERRNQYFKRSI